MWMFDFKAIGKDVGMVLVMIAFGFLIGHFIIGPLLGKITH